MEMEKEVGKKELEMLLLKCRFCVVRSAEERFFCPFLARATLRPALNPYSIGVSRLARLLSSTAAACSAYFISEAYFRARGEFSLPKPIVARAFGICTTRAALIPRHFLRAL